MSGGEPSSIKQFIRCAAGLPVRSGKDGTRMRMHARFSGVWPYYAVNLIFAGLGGSSYMHQALYRKWRPKTFDEVCGQEHITTVLKYEVSGNRLSHAYLFCGSRGTGKTTCAKLLAKAVNCENPIDGNPCGVCHACRSIDSGIATDVLEMDAASNNGVDYIRDIRDEVVYTPAELKYRVYIVDEVHMLSSGAFNALLKTLEEPPSHVIFILATTELHKLPATIISRCQRFDFRRIKAGVITDRLMHIASEENIGLEKDAAAMIAKLSRGGMRDAISTLELCAGTPEMITAKTVSESVGVSSRDSVVKIVEAIAQRELGTAFSVISEIEASSVDVAIFWQSVSEFYRDMLVMKTTGKAAEYLELLPSEEEECKKLAGLYTVERLIAHTKELDETQVRMQRNNGQRRLSAELSLVRLCDETLDNSNSALAARISALEETVARLKTAGVAPRVDKEDKKVIEEKTEPIKTQVSNEHEEVPPKEVQTEKKVFSAFSGWPEAIDRISQKNKAVGSFLSGTAAFTDGDSFIIKVSNKFFASMLGSPENLAIIADSVSVGIGRMVEPTAVRIDFAEQQKKNDDDILSQI